jgi:hypothetical protein
MRCINSSSVPRSIPRAAYHTRRVHPQGATGAAAVAGLATSRGGLQAAIGCFGDKSRRRQLLLDYRITSGNALRSRAASRSIPGAERRGQPLLALNLSKGPLEPVLASAFLPCKNNHPLSSAQLFCYVTDEASGG